MTEFADDTETSPLEPADEIIDSVHAFRRLFRAMRLKAIRGGQPHELTSMESRVLRFLGQQPGATQSELVSHTARDKGQMARLIGALRDRGLVETRVDGADRRVHRLYLTAEGGGVEASVRRRRRELARLAVTDLGEDEQRQLIGLLGRLCANLEAGD